MKNGWKKGVAKWRFEHEGGKLKNEDFAPLLQEVVKKTIKTSTIQNGFKTYGLLTLKIYDCDLSKLVGHTPTTSRVCEEAVHEIKGHLMFF